MTRRSLPAPAAAVSRGTGSFADFSVPSRVCVGARVSAPAGAHAPVCARMGGGAMWVGGQSSICASQSSFCQVKGRCSGALTMTQERPDDCSLQAPEFCKEAPHVGT